MPDFGGATSQESSLQEDPERTLVRLSRHCKESKNLRLAVLAKLRCWPFLQNSQVKSTCAFFSHAIVTWPGVPPMGSQAPGYSQALACTRGTARKGTCPVGFGMLRGPLPPAIFWTTSPAGIGERETRRTCRHAKEKMAMQRPH